MTSGVEIRPVRETDYEAWLPLWSGYNAFYGRVGATALDDGVTRTTWRRLHDPAEPVHGVVAVIDARLVGLTHYLFHRSTLSIGPSCYLQDLFTHEAARGRGVGRRLIDHVRDRAAEAGAGRLYWLTQETNATAMRLYDAVAERSGFIVYRMPLGL